MDGTLASKMADSRMRIKKWDKFSRESDFWLSIYSVVKCGIALPTSRSKDSEINMDGLSDYSIGESTDVEELTFYSDSDDDISD